MLGEIVFRLYHNVVKPSEASIVVWCIINKAGTEYPNDSYPSFLTIFILTQEPKQHTLVPASQRREKRRNESNVL